MDKVTLYLPIEIKWRELNSNILLSKFAAEYGFRVYVGSKLAISRLIKKKNTRAGVFIFKGGMETKQILKIREKIEKFIILDQEISPSCLDFENVMKNRIWPGSEKYIDRYYVIGQVAYESGLKALKKLSKKIKKTGWPRKDLNRNEFKFFYKKKIKEIRDKYGNFIFFSSAFGFNSKKKIDRVYEFKKNHKWKSVRKGLKNEIVGAFSTLEEFEANIEILRKLDKEKSCPQIIIRPHPAEDHNEWKKISKSFNKIKIIYEGDIDSWVYSSSALLHRGCASAITAYMNGTPIAYPILKKDNIKKALPYQLSEHLYNFSDILNFCKKNINKKPNPLKKFSKSFNRMVHIDKKFASENILDDILNLNIKKETNYKQNFFDIILMSLNEKIKHKINFIKEIIGLKDNLMWAPQSQKLPGGIGKKEIKNILKRLSKNNKIRVSDVFKDCVIIEKI